MTEASTDGAVRGTLRAGAASVVITPVGVELAGYDFGPSVGVLDALEAQALVLQGNGEPLATVTTDLIGLYRHLVEAVRQQVQATFGTPADCGSTTALYCARSFQMQRQHAKLCR